MGYVLCAVDHVSVCVDDTKYMVVSKLMSFYMFCAVDNVLCVWMIYKLHGVVLVDARIHVVCSGQRAGRVFTIAYQEIGKEERHQSCCRALHLNSCL